MALRSLVIVLVLISSSLFLPGQAQPRASVQQRLKEASEYFTQNDYFMGVSRTSEACAMLKSNPGAMPGTSYSALAARTVEDVNAKIRAAQSRKDIPSATRMVYALQPLLNSMAGWEPQNPFWRYEKGIMFRTMSALRNDQYPGELQSAVQEFDAALAMPGNMSFRGHAEQMRAVCLQALKRRGAEIADFKRTHPAHNWNNQAKPGGDEVWFCNNCGRQLVTQHSRCPFCGF